MNVRLRMRLPSRHPSFPYGFTTANFFSGTATLVPRQNDRDLPCCSARDRPLTWRAAAGRSILADYYRVTPGARLRSSTPTDLFATSSRPSRLRMCSSSCAPVAARAAREGAACSRRHPLANGPSCTTATWGRSSSVHLTTVSCPHSAVRPMPIWPISSLGAWLNWIWHVDEL